MIELPPVIPSVGLTHRIRLARDYYVRVDGADYSIDPRGDGPIRRCKRQPDRSWAKHVVVADPDYVSVAAQLDSVPWSGVLRIGEPSGS